MKHTRCDRYEGLFLSGETPKNLHQGMTWPQPSHVVSTEYSHQLPQGRPQLQTATSRDSQPSYQPSYHACKDTLLWLLTGIHKKSKQYWLKAGNHGCSLPSFLPKYLRCFLICLKVFHSHCRHPSLVNTL